MGIWHLAVFTVIGFLLASMDRKSLCGRPCIDDDEVSSRSERLLSFRSLAPKTFKSSRIWRATEHFQRYRLIDGIKVKLEARVIGHDHKFYIFFLPKLKFPSSIDNYDGCDMRTKDAFAIFMKNSVCSER